ncbi:MAG: DnaB-like helicase N-terminal domain-containing protein [Syntrophobacteraceae bacterium]
MPDKFPPFALEAEQSLLGGLLVDNSRFPDVLEILEGNEFYKDSHRLIYRAISDLFAKGSPADLVTVSDLLFSRNQLEAAGGVSYVSSLTDHMASADNVAAYAALIADKAQARRLIQAANEILSACYAGHRADEVAEKTEASIFGITEKRVKGRFCHISEIVRGNIEVIEKGSGQGGVAGHRSGFDDLDARIGGFRKSNLIFLAGRPGMGKTALALCIARNAARNGTSVGGFSGWRIL